MFDFCSSSLLVPPSFFYESFEFQDYFSHSHDNQIRKVKKDTHAPPVSDYV